MSGSKKKVNNKKKKRNILRETKKLNTPEPLEASDTERDENVTPSQPVTNNHNNKPIEQKRKEDRERQQKKRDKDKVETEAKDAQEDTELRLVVKTFCCMPFDFLAKRNDIWKLEEEEREAFTGSVIALMDKYAPVLAGYAVETSFALCACSILIPRLVFNGKENKQAVSDTGEEGNRKDPPS